MDWFFVAPPSVLMKGEASVAHVVAPPFLMAQVVALVSKAVALQAAPSEVRGGQRCLSVWVTGFLRKCALVGGCGVGVGVQVATKYRIIIR